MPINYEAIGKRIRKKRISLEWTQEQLAEKADLSPSFLGHIERGTRKMSLATAVALSRVLELPMDAMMGTMYENLYYLNVNYAEFQGLIRTLESVVEQFGRFQGGK